MASRAEVQADLAPILSAVQASGRRPLYAITGTNAVYADLGTCRRHVSSEVYAGQGGGPVVFLSPRDSVWALPLVGHPGELYRTAASPAAYAVVDGVRRWVTKAEHEAMGRPLVTVLPDVHPVFTLPLVGPAPLEA